MGKIRYKKFGREVLSASGHIRGTDGQGGLTISIIKTAVEAAVFIVLRAGDISTHLCNLHETFVTHLKNVKEPKE